MSDPQLTDSHLRHLEGAFHAGADQASAAMAVWLGVPSLIVIESLSQVPLADAPDLCGDPDTTLCQCAMSLDGSLQGQLVFTFDDRSGLSLTDLLLNHPIGTARDWGEVEQSAALESANIIGCAYLNSLADEISQMVPTIRELIPSPPAFQRDFAESLFQSLFISQATITNTVFLAKARFEIRGQPVNWLLLLVPDAGSLEVLREQLPDA